MEESQILEKRVNKIKKWIKNPYNFTFVAILAFTIIIRLYYFFLTKNQPLWWDEAEYMNMARMWAFNLEYEFSPVRPVLFSFITSLFFRITQSEILPRIFISLLSIISVAGVYYLGKEIYDKRVGLLASFIMAVFYLNLFFSTRLIVDIPSIVFFIFAALFFYRYFKKNSIKSLYIAAVLISIGTMFKQSTGFLLMAVFLYVLFTKGHKFIFKKELFIAALIFFLVMSPYLIFGYFQFGGFVLAQGASQVSPENPIMQGYTHIITYFSLFPTYLSWPLLILFLIGLVLIFKVFLGFDLLHKEGNFELKKDFFLILLFLIPIILAGFLINHTENRYIINSMPVIFIIASFGFFKIYDWIKKKNKLIPIIILILLLVYIGNFQLKATDSLISGKLDSYSEIRDSAYWFEENSLPTDIIMTTSIKQIPYYSWRKTIRFPKDESDFEELLASDSNIKFFMLSVYENSKEWAYSYPQRKNLTIATGFLRDQQPIAIIYYLNDSN